MVDNILLNIHIRDLAHELATATTNCPTPPACLLYNVRHTASLFFKFRAETLLPQVGSQSGERQHLNDSNRLFQALFGTPIPPVAFPGYWNIQKKPFPNEQCRVLRVAS